MQGLSQNSQIGRSPGRTSPYRQLLFNHEYVRQRGPGTFCGRPQREVSKLIAGPHAAICDACVELAEHVVTSSSATDTPLGQMYAVLAKDGQARCSFCGKQRYQVTGLAAMPMESRGKFSGPAAICVECLSLCNEIIAEEPA